MITSHDTQSPNIPLVIVGKLIGSACACTGILALALPVPVIVSNFERFYSKSQEQATQHSEERRKKSAKYKALKGLFERLKRRGEFKDTQEGEREEEYFDMGACVEVGVKVASKETKNCIPLIQKNGKLMKASSV